MLIFKHLKYEVWNSDIIQDIIQKQIIREKKTTFPHMIYIFV